MLILIIFLQVYPGGIRHICSDKRVNEWKAPGKRTIVKCAVNQRQVVIALSGGELAYFEMDPVILLFILQDNAQICSDINSIDCLFFICAR